MPVFGVTKHSLPGLVSNCVSDTSAPPNRILMVPGLCEPPVALSMLRRALQKRCPQVDIFRDRIAFRQIDRSVDRLRCQLQRRDRDDSVAVITHSFGDWVARQVIFGATDHAVDALVSIAPVMRAGWLPIGLHLISGNLLPEIKVMMDPSRVATHLDIDRSIRRLVIWAKADESVREVDLGHLKHVQVRRVDGTHISVVLQRSVHGMIGDFLFASGSRHSCSPPSDTRPGEECENRGT